MSIFLHTYRPTHTHTAHAHKDVENSLKFCLGYGTKMFLAHAALAHLSNPQGGIQQFLVSRPPRPIPKEPCMLASSPSLPPCLVEGSIHQLTLDFLYFCRCLYVRNEVPVLGLLPLSGFFFAFAIAVAIAFLPFSRAPLACSYTKDMLNTHAIVRASIVLHSINYNLYVSLAFYLCLNFIQG